MTGANRHDSPCLPELLARRAKPGKSLPERENVCLDKGYFGEPSETACAENGYVAHIRSRSEEKKGSEEGEEARRWVVERTNSWFNQFRRLLVRYEKKASRYEAFLELACALITFRTLFSISG